MHAVAAGLGEDRLDVGDALLAVALGDQRHVVGADRLGEGVAALVPGGVVGVGQRADRVDHGRLVGGEQPRRPSGCHGGDGAALPRSTRRRFNGFAQRSSRSKDIRLPPWQIVFFWMGGNVSDAITTRKAQTCASKPRATRFVRRLHAATALSVAERTHGGRHHGRHGFGTQSAGRRGGGRAGTDRWRDAPRRLRRHGIRRPCVDELQFGVPGPLHARLRRQGRLPRGHPAPAARATAWPARWRARASWSRRCGAGFAPDAHRLRFSGQDLGRDPHGAPPRHDPQHRQLAGARAGRRGAGRAGRLPLGDRHPDQSAGRRRHHRRHEHGDPDLQVRHRAGRSPATARA